MGTIRKTVRLEYADRAIPAKLLVDVELELSDDGTRIEPLDHEGHRFRYSYRVIDDASGEERWYVFVERPG